ncbi:hypothetical protein M9H77_20742 [Catharanthus roseus]|uniref:Uncharacterized protein n=1 Tax=Catharanthus roseus TaxID=4058 RepID=A0ACC0AKT1_CATRO|nr:hypothetical protein M9H77_20742 [Catharanthus roseus]
MKKMMIKNRLIRLVVVLGVILIISNNKVVESASSSGAGAAAPAVDCSSLTLTMADCLSFVTSGSTVEKPEGSCCSGLKTTLKTDAECLCEGFKNSAQLGITLNVTKALSLPAACHVSAPSVTHCGLNINLDGSPAVSPMASSPVPAAATPPTTSSGTMEVTASPPPETSGSTILQAAASFESLVLCLGLLFAYFSF